MNKKYQGGQRYQCFFDTIPVDSKLTEEQKEKNEKRRLEAKEHEEKWLRESSVIEGIPGRCKVIDRSEAETYTNMKLFGNKAFFQEWVDDSESVLYYYNDLQFLSGSAGYVLVKPDGTKKQYMAVVS